MEPKFDRELDALLRRAAPRTAMPARAADHTLALPHPDADELAAFAENALPAPARAAMITHLADCTECRHAAASLVSAAGASAELDRQSAAGPSPAVRESGPLGWRARLAALFAPRFLRFAAPALALGLVGVVSFMALRAGRPGVSDGSLTAEQRAPVIERPAPSVPGAAADASTNMNASVAVEDQLTRQPNGSQAAASPGGGTAGRARDEEGRRSKEEVPSADARRGEFPPPPEAAFADKGGRAQAGGADAPATQALELAAEPKKETEARRRDEADQVAQVTDTSRQNRAEQSRVFENQQAPDGSNVRGRSVQNLGVNAPPPPSSTARETASAGAAGPAPAARKRAADSAAAGEKADGDAAETRTVEGRRFRRVDGVWVDTNFRDTLPTTGVRRGTEAYRALVAELPEVGRAAERLGGEVVVVVRGRAYRIK